MPRGLVAMARSGGHCPLRVSGGILCSERGQSRDAFQAIRLEEISPRCNKHIYCSLLIYIKRHRGTKGLTMYPKKEYLDNDCLRRSRSKISKTIRVEIEHTFGSELATDMLLLYTTFIPCFSGRGGVKAPTGTGYGTNMPLMRPCTTVLPTTLSTSET